MAAPSSASSASAHPFHSRERLHFPEFSPVFSRHDTPESGQQSQRAFHWSIDHIARLKPADIDTDPSTLVTTNGPSPENDEETQQAAERFFSQRSILPSPWPAAQTRSSMRHTPAAPRTLLPPSLTPGLAKKVTFSPLPPSMAYIRNDSQESDIREDGLVDAATQTAVTIPLAYNLDELLGPAYIYTGGAETSIAATRDLANTSLRRKLFGKPDRIMEEGEGEGEGVEGESDVQLSTAYVTPLNRSSERHLSSTPLKPRSSHTHQQHSSHTPRHSSPSPQIILTRVGGIRKKDDTNPATSSFVLTPGGDLPEFSPIEGVTEGDEFSAGRTKENSEACKRLFSNTPKKLTPQSTYLTPSPLPTCPPFSPILSHPGSSGGVRSEGGGRGDGVMREPTTPTAAATNGVSSANKATSTPYHSGLKRQLTTSSAQCSGSLLPNTLHTRDEGGRERREENGERGEVGEREGDGVELVMMVGGGGQEMEIGQGGKETEQDGESEASEELPQPLSIADLQTENDDDDLTSITGITTCTSYFTQLATEDGDSNAASERQQPLHSTVAVPNSVWNPSINAAEPRWGAHLAEDNTAGCYRLPSIREISRINAPSMNATDSGVAASSYFNQPTGGSLAQLTSSGGVGGALNLTKPPTDLEYRKQAENEQTEQKQRENSDDPRRHQRPGSQSSEVDSGLATSPDQDAAPAGVRLEGTREGDVGAPKWRPPLTKPPTPVSTLHSHPPHSSSITPTRYSTIQFYRNRLGVPLAVTQRSGFYSNRALLRSDVLPSQLKLSPFSFPRSPGFSGKTSVALTPNRHTGCSNWFGGGGGGGSLTGQAGFSSPGFPDEVLRKKETLKAKLQFCSPVRSRSPVSPLPSTRRPLSGTLNLPSPAANHPFSSLPFSPLPSSHPLLSPLPSRGAPPSSYNHLLPSSPSHFPLSPLNLPQRGTLTDMWQQAAHWQHTQ